MVFVLMGERMMHELIEWTRKDLGEYITIGSSCDYMEGMAKMYGKGRSKSEDGHDRNHFFKLRVLT